MKFYISYFLTAILTSWLIVVYLGVSAGFSNYTPIAALLGSLILFVVAAPILVYYFKLGLIAGLVGCLLIIPFSVSISKVIFESEPLSWGVLIILPSIMTLLSTYFTIMALFFEKRNVLVGTTFNGLVKAMLSTVPVVLFILYLIFYGRYWSWSMFEV